MSMSWSRGQFRMVAKSSWSWTRCCAVALGTRGGGATGAGWSVQPAADVAALPLASALPLAFAVGLHFAGIAPGDSQAEAASRPKQPPSAAFRLRPLLISLGPGGYGQLTTTMVAAATARMLMLIMEGW